MFRRIIAVMAVSVMLVGITGCRFLDDGNGQVDLDFVVVDMQGEDVRLGDMIGEPIVLNFWTSWCAACRRAMPAFEGVYGEMGGEVRFMMVNMPDGWQETVEIATRYIEGNGYSFPVYFDVDGEARGAFGVRAVPTTVFIDRNGEISDTVMGVMSEEDLREQIGMIL